MAILKFTNNTVVPKTVIIAVALINAANVLDFPDMWVTSGNDSVHMKGSKHYTDEALDFRTHHLPKGDAEVLKISVQQRLGRDYQCILEDLGGPNEHLHIEFDPAHKV